MASFLYFASAVLAIRLSVLSADMAAFWPPNAVMLYALLVAPRRQRWKYFGGAVAASLAANLAAREPLAPAMIFTASNLVEVWLVLGLLRGLGVPRNQLLEPRGLAAFPAVAAVNAAVSATLANLAQPEWFGRFWLSWFGSDLLGMVLVVPAMLVLFGRDVPRRAAGGNNSLARNFLALGVAGLVAALAFVYSSAPLVFFCILPVNYAVFRFGARGAIYAALIFASVSIAATLSGHGPFAAYTQDKAMQVYLLQAFLAALLLAGLPLAAMQAREQRAAQRVLAAERAARSLLNQRQRTLELSARQTALASNRDSLTGLATRARILARLAHRLAFQARTGTPVVVALIDIDHFKSINDRHGHDHGDTVLRRFGALARASFAAPHAVGRLGGEEFLVVLVGLDVTQAMGQMERFRLAVAAHGRDLECGLVSISTGVAAAQPGINPSQLLKVADMALLLAKRQGRDRTLLAA